MRIAQRVVLLTASVQLQQAPAQASRKVRAAIHVVSSPYYPDCWLPGTTLEATTVNEIRLLQ